MAQFQVDSEQIQSSSAAVNASIQAIRRRCRACTPISTICERLEGRSGHTVHAVAGQWRAAQQQMEQSLESIQHALTQASALYAETEMQASRLFGAVAAGTSDAIKAIAGSKQKVEPASTMGNGLHL